MAKELIKFHHEKYGQIEAILHKKELLLNLNNISCLFGFTFRSTVMFLDTENIGIFQIETVNGEQSKTFVNKKGVEQIFDCSEKTDKFKYHQWINNIFEVIL